MSRPETWIGLPISSGEIESAHRYIIRRRLKIAGAWRKENNAQNMISLTQQLRELERYGIICRKYIRWFRRKSNIL